MKNALIAAAAVPLACAAAPSVDISSVTQDVSTRAITVAYTVTDGPAVITFSAATNGVELAGEELWEAEGDVNAYVAASSGSFVWTPSLGTDVSPSASLSITVTAWPLDDTPDYMAVPLVTNAASRIRYYPTRAQIPGGDLDPRYRTSVMLMRKCAASGAVFTMGSESETSLKNEGSHEATLDHSYYIGVFETTQAQWALVMKDYTVTVASKCTIEGALRPAESMNFHHIREDRANTASTTYRYPAAPCGISFMGYMRSRTKCAQFPDGVDFDLPGEAQWEYACRAGNGDGLWGNGVAISKTSAGAKTTTPGRYNGNQASEGTAFSEAQAATMGPSNCTAICGSYPPNDWGIYDMHGNVWEWCLDWYQDDITGLNGAVNAKGAYLADGTTAGTDRVRRGGCWYNSFTDLRSARRLNRAPSGAISWLGFRTCCRAGLK